MKIGLLGFYLELYDKSVPERRPGMEEFYSVIASELELRNLDVVRTSLCRLKSEFAEAVQMFEKKGADAVITLHLAYSPSLESADVLAGTDLPLIVLDTTPGFEFSPQTDPDALMYNHGIHGVMDMCNLLKRSGKQYLIEAGHWKESDVLDRAVRDIQSVKMASVFRNARVGLIGDPFKGMGDFAVPFEALGEQFGMKVIQRSPAEIAAGISDLDTADVDAEIAYDRDRFNADDLDTAGHHTSVRAGLALREWVEKEKLTAFSMNFLAIDKKCGLGAVPFLEACKAMAQGIGYAREGDVLTAAYVSALMSVFAETTFTEIFCPDWKNGTLFLSHMGEVNVNLIEGKPKLILKPWPYTDADEPVAAVGCLKPGSGMFSDLAPGPGGEYTLILVRGEMEKVKGEDKMENMVHGWFRPDCGIETCLAEYSRAGGTHHSAFTYGDCMRELKGFAELMKWKIKVID